MPPPGAKIERPVKGPLAPGMPGGGQSDLDALIAQVQQQGGVSAPPDAPSPGKPVAPADVPQMTSQNGMAGVMDALKAAGWMSPGQFSGAADQLVQQVGAANQNAIGAIQGNVDKRAAITGAPIPRPAIPQLQGMPQAPDTKAKNPLQVFSQSGAILAMLASLFTRKPLVTAMNAAAAAMKGYQEGDKESAERAHKDWKDHLEAAVAQNQAEMDQYNLLLSDTTLQQQDRNAQLQALAASNQDENMLAALRSGAPEMAFKILEARQKSAESLVGILTQAQQQDQQMQLERDRLNEERRYHDQITGAANGGGGPLDPETVVMLGTQYRAGDPSALTGLGQDRQGMMARQQVLKWVANHPNGDGTPDVALSRADYAANKGTLKQMQNYISRADTFQNVFLKNVQQVEKYSKAGVAGEVPAINKWIQAGRKATGDPNVAAFDAAIKTASREYARIMSGPTSNAQLTVSAQANADDMLSNAMNAEQLQAVIAVMKRDIQNSIGAAQDTMTAIREDISADPGAGDHAYKATMPDNRAIHSDDGQVWFYDDDGSAVQ